MNSVEQMQRFWDKVSVQGNDACWLWTASRCGGKNKDYGKFENGYAHRFIFKWEHGYLPKVVRHTCDTPLCVNPRHLLPGTQADNVRDMVARKGANRTCKLSEDDVIVIRQRLADGHLHKDIAVDFGVHRATVSQINRGANWATLQN